MVLTFEAFRKKVQGCWDGKNAGGNLGAPKEGYRGVFDFNGYLQQADQKPLPNDDLDLQLVWLNAAERYGRSLNASILAEYWLNCIIPDWSEYGQGKSNLRAGIVPPLSGHTENLFEHSNGAFILSEIWACLNPGYPQKAAAMAYEDACVNHSGEGLYAAVFCAAVESAAFAESDTRRLISIGLSYIPENCGVSCGVRCAMDAYDSGLSWQQARKKVLQTVPGSFGALVTPVEEFEPDEPLGERGYDAPSNIGIMVIGWLYGEGDFGNSICIAANCGEDTDCTAGTLGAILGIIHGSEYMGEKWLAPLGGNIETLCIDRTKYDINIPSTTMELTDRILRLAPVFLDRDACRFSIDAPGYNIFIPEESLYCSGRRLGPWNTVEFQELLDESPDTVRYSTALFDVRLRYDGGIGIEPGAAKSMELAVANKWAIQQWIDIRWVLPEGWEIQPGPCRRISLEQSCNLPDSKATFTLVPGTLTQPVYELFVRISSVGHPTSMVIPVRLFV